MTSSPLNQPLLVLTNVPEAELAERLSRQLVEQQLAACVNILPAVTSIYRWADKIEQASEIPLLIKTTQARYGEVERAILAAHPYDVPEIIIVPVAGGLPSYLQWMRDETAAPLQT
ncbi:divalent-cation tolerance protein CutA [Herbaspirillum sp. alder98]|uniref:divalent-cation tolerance protein CutA n=1 Tax=Herbaspirillum sp. alder98 TaxID=2913096 RepID=UPI001CD8EA03|nr:divalent-cation tolerance protein CutA [Herbaspirillum sp. alder98]MCA1325710.1 divalent-cation tolerance protein CutA [Herbaspirillum sp. alder98]